tara:strand:- start:48 stop:1334 length:1287 start_codon:yes stop_codon:yes gene_type:complete
MNEEMMTTGFTGGDTATGPTAGYDPVMKMRAKLKDLKGLVAPGNKLGTSNKKKVKAEDYQYEAKVDKKLPEYKRATARDKRYGNPHGSHELGGGIRKDRRADHEAKRGLKKEDKYDRYKRMIRHKQDKYGKGGPVGADYDTSKDPHYQKQKAQKREKIQKIVNKSKVDEARNTKADANTLRSVSTPRMQGKKGNVNLKGRSVTGGAAMSGMNIRAAGGLGKSKPKDVAGIVAKYKKQIKSDRIAATKQRAKEKAAGIKEAIAPSPQEIQVHKKISMLQQKLAQLRKKTVNQASKGAAAATSQEATQESIGYKYVSSINEKRKTKVNLNPTTKDTKGEGKFVNKYNPRYLSYTESVVDRCPPNKLFQYKVKLPEVGETVVYANSPAELMQKLRLLINPRFRGGIEIDRIFPHDAYKFFTDKRTKALRRK